MTGKNNNIDTCYAQSRKLFGDMFTQFLEDYTQEVIDGGIHVDEYDDKNLCAQLIKTLLSDILSLQIKQPESADDSEICSLYVLPVKMACTNAKNSKGALWELEYGKYITGENENKIRKIQNEEDIREFAKDFFVRREWKKDDVEKAIVVLNPKVDNKNAGLFLELKFGNRDRKIEDTSPNNLTDLHEECEKNINGSKNLHHFKYSNEGEQYRDIKISVQYVCICIDKQLSGVVTEQCRHTNRINSDTISVINDTFKRLFNIGLNLKKFVEFKSTRVSLAEAQKQAQMLQLLKKPLDSLTKALEQTQQDTQILRSILYDPHKSLFAVAPLVEDYFEEGRECSYGKIFWKGMHTIGGVTVQKGGRDAAAMLAAIICHIYGREPEGIENDLGLYRAAEESLMSRNLEFGHLRGALASLVPRGDIGKVANQLRMHLAGQPNRNEPLDAITSLLNRLKAAIFTPFKFSGETPFLPLALILADYGYQKEEKIELKAMQEVSVSNGNHSFLLKDGLHGEIYNTVIFPGDALLVLRYSNILSLISGVLGYMHDENAKISNVVLSRKFSSGINSKIEIGSLSIEFDTNIFNLDELPSTFALMNTASKNFLRMTQGNFRKPFVDFALVTQGNIEMPDIEKEGERKGEKKNNTDQMRWVVSKENSRLELCVKSNIFSLEVGKINSRGSHVS